MPRGQEVFAKIEVNFWGDPRARSLRSANALLFYYQTWITAVDERREILPAHFTAASIGERCHLTEKESVTALKRCVEKELLEFDGKRIRVTGVIAKHASHKFLFKDNGSPNVPERGQTGKDGDKRGQAGTRVPEQSRVGAKGSPEKRREEESRGEKSRLKVNPQFPDLLQSERIRELLAATGVSETTFRRQTKRRKASLDWVVASLLATQAKMNGDGESLRNPGAYFTAACGADEPPADDLLRAGRMMVDEVKLEERKGGRG